MTFLKSRSTALIACGIAAILFLLIVVTPVIAAFSAQSDEIDTALNQLGFYRAEIASKPALQAQLKALDEKGASVPGVIDTDSTAIAQAQLQSQIKALVEASSGSVRSMQIMPSARQGSFEIIAVQCDLSIPERRLKDLAYAVAAHTPYLFVDEASVSAPASEPDNVLQQTTLDIRWTIHGYRWGRPK